MATDLSTDIATQAVEPVTSSGDGQSATARPIADMMLADQYLAAKAAMKNRRRGIQFAQMTNPGCPSDGGGVYPSGGIYPFGGGVG